MSRPTIITLPVLNRVLARVVPELEELGFWDDAVASDDVVLTIASLRFYGLQDYGATQRIESPAVQGPRLWNRVFGTHRSLADILRHEYGHVVADTHRGLIRSRQFRDAFDAAHADECRFEYDRACTSRRTPPRAPAKTSRRCSCTSSATGGRCPRASTRPRSAVAGKST